MYILYIDCYVDDLGEVDEMDDLGFAEKKHKLLLVGDIWKQVYHIFFLEKQLFEKHLVYVGIAPLGFCLPRWFGANFFL